MVTDAPEWRVYLIVHRGSGKVYVGQTRQNVQRRWWQHCRGDSQCSRLRAAILAFGADAFDMFVLGVFSTAFEASLCEGSLVALHKSTNETWGYNVIATPQSGIRTSRKTRCKRGHEVSSPELRDHRGDCLECRRLRACEKRAKFRTVHPRKKGGVPLGFRKTECKHGHDISTAESRNSRGVCRVCSNRRDVERNKTPARREQVRLSGLRRTARLAQEAACPSRK